MQQLQCLSSAVCDELHLFLVSDFCVFWHMAYGACQGALHFDCNGL